jgi:prepilin-type processing-associated H-X9-DG protein
VIFATLLSAANDQIFCGKEAQVISPSEMMAHGDTILGIFPQLPALGFLTWWDFPKMGEDYKRSRLLTAQRHAPKWNIVFADGHTERFTTNALFGKNKYDPADEPMRPRWNRDHQPHWEELQ